MPFYAWYSRKSERRDGTATYTKPNGREVEVSFVVEGSDELSVEPNFDTTELNDLVFLGEVVRCTRLATELPIRPEDWVDEGDFE